jgi:hypothetical protein
MYVPVGALTDRTFRFKNRVWFLKPMNAHRDCPKCSGKVTIWNRGDEVYRVTARKDEWGEVDEWICNECRFEKKSTSDWTIEGPTKISRQSVISQGHYVGVHTPRETFPEIMKGAQPRLLMDIHSVSEVNQPGIELSEIKGPAHSDDFKNAKPNNKQLSWNTILLAFDWGFVIEKLVLIIGIVSISLLIAMYETYAERKVAAVMQDRIGPDRAGPFGILQPMADGLKLFMKEGNHSKYIEQVALCTGPCLAMLTAMMTSAVIPWGDKIHFTLFGQDRYINLQIADINIGILFIFGWGVWVYME